MTKTIKKLLDDIYELTCRVNNETKMGAWFEIAGHINCLTIHVVKNKKEYEKKIYWNPVISLTSNRDINELKKAKKKLQSYLKDIK